MHTTGARRRRDDRRPGLFADINGVPETTGQQDRFVKRDAGGFLPPAGGKGSDRMSVYRRGKTWIMHVTWTAGVEETRQAKQGGFRYKKDAEAADAELLEVRPARAATCPWDGSASASTSPGGLTGLSVSGRRPRRSRRTGPRPLQPRARPDRRRPLVDLLTPSTLTRVYSAMVEYTG